MLARHPGDVEGALVAWERQLCPAIDVFQRSALLMRSLFVQTTPDEQRRQVRSIGLRRFMMKIPMLTTLMTRSKHFRLRNGDLAALLS